MTQRRMPVWPNTEIDLRPVPGTVGHRGKRPAAASVTALLALAVLALSAGPGTAQTVTVVGTPHLTELDHPPSLEQLAHAVEVLSTFRPTQVCVERMSGERIEVLVADPGRYGLTLQPRLHGRPLASAIVPIGVEMQVMLERRPADARAEARELVGRWDELDARGRLRAVGLQLAGFEFHSAALNWSYLNERDRREGGELFGSRIVEALEKSLASVHEVYSVGIPLAREAGLHELCTVDSLEDEARGMMAAIEHGGQAIIDDLKVQARIEELLARGAEAWRFEEGPEAMVAMLRFFNSDEFAELDRRLQWETLREFDNEAGAFHRRLMYWHARTAEISAELFRALARGPEERVLFIVGAAHRPFTEADLGAQPWFEVMSAKTLLGEH